MSFMRCMSSGVMFCIAPDIWSTICCVSCWRSLSSSCSKRCCGLGRLEVVRLQLADLAGEVVGQHVEAEVAIGGGVACAFWARRSSPLRSAACGGVVDGVALLVDDVVSSSAISS